MGIMTKIEREELENLKIKLFKDATWSVFVNNNYPRDVRRYTYLINKNINSILTADNFSKVIDKD